MKAQIVRLLGIVLFVAAFFLPAAKSPGTGPGTGPMVGWACAAAAAAATGGVLRMGELQWSEGVGAVCLILSGWLNPLVVFYLLVSLWKRLVVLRRILASAILVCIVATWVFFAQTPMIPLVGHYLWVAGALLILAGEVVGRRFDADPAAL